MKHIFAVSLWLDFLFLCVVKRLPGRIHSHCWYTQSNENNPVKWNGLLLQYIIERGQKKKKGRKNSEKRQHIKKLAKKRNDQTWRNGNLKRYERMFLACHANLKNVIASRSNEMYWNFYCVRLLMLWSFVDFYFLFLGVLFLSCDSVRSGPFVIFSSLFFMLSIVSRNS